MRDNSYERNMRIDNAAANNLMVMHMGQNSPIESRQYAGVNQDRTHLGII